MTVPVNIWPTCSSGTNTFPKHRYSGSLTTPPCSEGVNWLVSTQTLRIQPSTFEKVRNIIGFNSRITQNAPGQVNLQTEAVARLMSDLSQAAAIVGAATPAASKPAPPVAPAASAAPVVTQTEGTITVGKK